MIDEVLYQAALIECSNRALTAVSLAIVVSGLWLMFAVSKLLYFAYRRFSTSPEKDIL